MKYVILLAALALGGAAAAAQIDNAQTPPAAAPRQLTPAAIKAMQLCKPDFEKLCPGMHFGDGKLGPCLREHRADLSPVCGAALVKLRGARPQ